jgi:hypothetical protein
LIKRFNMKSLFLFMAACVCSQAFSQTDPTFQTGDSASITSADTAVAPPPAMVDAAPVSRQNKKGNYPKTVVKMNVSSLLFKNYQFELERSLTRRISALVSYRTMGATPLSQQPALRKGYRLAGEDDGALEDDWGNISASNKTYTAGFRFYMGSRPGPRGFYAGVYGRYAQFKVDYDYVYETDAKNYLIPVASATKGVGGGVYFGVQWLIAKRVALDWQILGGHWGKLSGSGSSATDLSELTVQDKQSVKDDLESLLPDIGGNHYINADVTNSGVRLKIDGPFAGLRSGISLGISF